MGRSKWLSMKIKVCMSWEMSIGRKWISCWSWTGGWLIIWMRSLRLWWGRGLNDVRKWEKRLIFDIFVIVNVLIGYMILLQGYGFEDFFIFLNEKLIFDCNCSFYTLFYWFYLYARLDKVKNQPVSKRLRQVQFSPQERTIIYRLKHNNNSYSLLEYFPKCYCTMCL